MWLYIFRTSLPNVRFYFFLPLRQADIYVITYVFEEAKVTQILLLKYFLTLTIETHIHSSILWTIGCKSLQSFNTVFVSHLAFIQSSCRITTDGRSFKHPEMYFRLWNHSLFIDLSQPWSEFWIDCCPSLKLQNYFEI